MTRPTTPSALEVVTTRVFPAAAEAVFDAFADPARLALWWGPEGFTNEIHRFDLRAGGTWRVTMRSADGAAFDNESEFVEVDRPRRVVFRHLEPIHRFVMTMDFARLGARTLLTWTMRFESEAEVARLRAFLTTANEQNLDRLATLLAQGPRR